MRREVGGDLVHEEQKLDVVGGKLEHVGIDLPGDHGNEELLVLLGCKGVEIDNIDGDPALLTRGEEGSHVHGDAVVEHELVQADGKVIEVLGELLPLPVGDDVGGIVQTHDPWIADHGGHPGEILDHGPALPCRLEELVQEVLGCLPVAGTLLVPHDPHQTVANQVEGLDEILLRDVTGGVLQRVDG